MGGEIGGDAFCPNAMAYLLLTGPCFIYKI
jgi:hypothetical protein